MCSLVPYTLFPFDIGFIANQIVNELSQAHCYVVQCSVFDWLSVFVQHSIGTLITINVSAREPSSVWYN